MDVLENEIYSEKWKIVLVVLLTLTVIAIISVVSAVKGCSGKTPGTTTTSEVSEVWVYPVKGCRGIKAASWEIAKTGFLYDREWMFVNGRNRFISQRTHPKLATVKTEVTESGDLVLKAEGMDTLVVDNSKTKNRAIREVTVWRATLPAFDEGEEAAKWMDDFLNDKGLHPRLVRFDRKQKRPTSNEKGEVAFSDGYPFLLISQESLNLLNEKLTAPVSMTRFRPKWVLFN